MHVYMRFELAESDIQGLFTWGELAWPTLVFNAILTSRQTLEKLQCLYENLMSNNFCRTAVLKKNMNCKLKLHPKDSTEKNWGGYIR